MLTSIHALIRAPFVRIEAAFNRVFGDAQNPLYHLGQIACLLFAVVFVSGFYVYAFYETGLDATYASVERLTHAQWWAGGIARSLHRHASAGMVIVVLLHLARHFAFDRYRGFRAFSWVSGLAAVVLVYVSAVNGYMLPWDRLAQYTVTTVAEWFDALPVFRGRLVRNFILPGALTDRFFSLLQFLHIGIPLAALAALWIHVQRVPRARIFPPRGLTLALLAALLAVSLLWPAVSQAPADLAHEPEAVALDWFYLAGLPVVTLGHGTLLWWVVGGTALVFLVLPWLPPLRASGALPWNMTLHGANAKTHAVAVRAGETLLDAALRAQVPVDFECRSGGCGRCRATVLLGDVDAGIYQPAALSAAARARGEVLLCCARARSDVEIELPEAATGGAAASAVAAERYDTVVERLQPLAPDVRLLALRLQHGREIAFEAGQYLNVILGDGARRSYSFTVRSGRTDVIELHVRRVPGGRFTAQVFDTLRVGDPLPVEGPLGRALLRETITRPLIFVAGATGFAPVKSLLEQAFAMRLTQPLYLYWGVRRRHDLYMVELPERWSAGHANFHFVPVLSEPAPQDAWTGRVGLVHAAILEDFPDLSGMAVYACGSVSMIEAARPELLAQGLPDAFCYSDALIASGGASTSTS